MNLTTNDSSNWNLGMFPADIASTIVNSQLALGSAAAVASGLVWYLLRSDDSQVKRIRPLPFFGQWSFFTRRYGKTRIENHPPLGVINDSQHRFHSRWIQEIPQERSFGFGILGHNVVAVRGEEARKAFFSSSSLNFTEGYQLLFGGGPSTKDISQDAAKRNDQEELSFFLRHLVPLLKNDRLAKLTPELMSDIERNMKSWGDAGKFDPFEVMYSTVFQLTIRAAGAREIADSVEKCKQLEELYWKVEKGSTAASLLLPWLPSAARKQKVDSTTEIYTIFDQIIKDRQREGRREEDALQTFIDQGDSMVDIIGFVMGVLFAGIVNTGLMSAWIYIHLDQVPEWKDKAVEEIRPYFTTILEDSATSLEDEMPVLETCIRETIRLIVSGAALRRVVSGDTEIDGKKIPNGTFLVYSMGETHTNTNIYPNPSQYDPGRYVEGQDKAQTYGFLGWGVGRHSLRRPSLCSVRDQVHGIHVLGFVDSAGKKPDHQ
ncbi:Cytochrome P450 [Rhizoctonia solani]|uniref:Cytochrome P450 n=1 Tax=Rhizoctonia solani TaxID=456999 RepID=A0A8H7I4F5_9AGAM|nr:Cytochrome P450 [Rhizoctonia solani]